MTRYTKREIIVRYASIFFILTGGLSFMLLFASTMGSVTGIGPSTRITQQQLIPFIIVAVLGIAIGGLVGGYAWLLVMRKFATPDEVYMSLVYGGWVPILTPLSMKLFRRHYSDEQMYRPNSWLSLISELDRSDFYKYMEPIKVERAQARVARTGDPFDFSTRRVYDIDAEELAEGGIADFFDDVRSFFTLAGIGPIGVKQNFTEAAYGLYVNDREYEIYTQSEMEREENLWLLVAQRTFSILDELLEKGKAEERTYLLATGDHVIFLTPQQYQIIWSSNLIPLHEKPLNIYEQPTQPVTNKDTGNLSTGG